MSLAEQIKQQQVEQLSLLVKWFGTQKMLANRLGVSKQTVSNWVVRGRISATAAKNAQNATKGVFTKEDLRPDVIEWSE